MLQFKGMDASESFEDVGHSDDARAILDTLQVGVVAPVRKRHAWGI